ncbi:MAG: holo-ACP synthase [Simkania sp.]|nr:holo-ACP synthase [Simkania sp.]
MSPKHSILGIGNDIIEIERIRLSIENHGDRFLNRLFTPRERAYCLGFRDPHPRFAGRFAAKEAVVKALGCGFGKSVSWHDVEIINNEEGKPIVHLAAHLLQKFGTRDILITISHCKLYATAVAIRTW